VLGVEQLRPAGFLGDPLRVGALRDREERIGVTPPDDGGRAAVDQAPGPILTDRFQQRVARVAIGPAGHEHQRLVHQPREQVEQGPVWFGDGRYLLWSDIPNDSIMKWEEETGAVSVFRKPAHFANGNTRDRQGRLLTCEHDTRRLTRTEYDGSTTVLADRFDGKPLNSPNDVVCRSDGSIWFTDPPFGILGNYEGHTAKPELPTNVYRLDPGSSRLEVVAGDIARPNGLCFSPDERRLYVVEAGVTPRVIRVYDVAGESKLSNGRVLITRSRAARPTACAAT
jgi:sugar lactone lactonase YvrE